MKEQEFRQALQRMTASASFSDENKQEVMEHIQSKRSKQSIRLPAPRKRSLALGMLIVLLVITVGAMAAEGWGILSFLRDQGKNPSADQLLSLYGTPYLHPIEHQEDDIADMVITEALYEDGTLYLAATLTALKENTLVVPVPGAYLPKMDWNSTDLNSMNPSTFTMQEAMQNEAYGNVTVLDYAKANDFDKVAVVNFYSVGMYSNQKSWLEDQFGGLQHVAYNLLADGTLQIILEVGYQPNLTFADGRYETAGMSMELWLFDITGEGKWLYGRTASAHASFVIPDDRERLRSIPEDAHDIVGYIGEMEYISIAPYDDEYMTITIQLNLRDDATEDTWMSGPAWIIMDEEGNRLCEVDQTKFYSLRTSADENGNRLDITHGVFPVECMPKGNKITLRAENNHNSTIVYDEYTYTLITNQETAEEVLR